MKYIIIGLASSLLFAGTALAANPHLISNPWMRIDDIIHPADIYRTVDAENGIVCYTVFYQTQYTSNPSISCVKK